MPVSEDVLQAWTSFSSATSALDFYLDSTRDPRDRSRIIDNVLEFAHPQSSKQSFASSDEQFNQRMDDFRRHLRERPLKRQESFFRALKQILDVTEQIKRAPTIDELVKLTRIEGQLTMRMILNLLPDEFHQNPNYHRYSRLMKRLGRLANTSDTFIDLHDDYHAGEISVAPSLRNRGFMLERVFVDAMDAARHLKPIIAKEIVVAFAHQLKRKKPHRKPQTVFQVNQ